MSSSDKVCDTGNSRASESRLIDIQVHGVLAPDPRLRVALTNQSDEKLLIFEHSLPWRGAYSMIILAVETDPAGTPLKRTLPIDDPGPGTTTIEPGETVSSEIALAPRFPDLPRILADKDVLVFWAYRFQQVGEPPLPWAAGHVILPRATSGGRPGD